MNYSICYAGNTEYAATLPEATQRAKAISQRTLHTISILKGAELIETWMPKVTKQGRVSFRRVLAVQHPKQGLTVRNGVPVFAIVFTPDDVREAAGISKRMATHLIRNHADKFVDGFLNNDWQTIIAAVVDCLRDDQKGGAA